MFIFNWIARLFYSKEEVEQMDQKNILKTKPKRKRRSKR